MHMDKASINKAIQIGIFRELYKQNLLTKAQLDKAIKIIIRNEANAQPSME